MSGRNYLIGDRAFYKKVALIILPLILQNTISNVVNLVDNVMVGAVGTLEMSSVAIVNQLVFIFMLVIFGGLAGAGIFSAQYAGAQDHEGVRHCFRIKLIIALTMFVIAGTVFFLFSENLIGLYIAEDTSAADRAATLGFGKQYFEIIIIGLLPFALSQTYSSTLRELGETRLPMIASIAAILTNLFFNWLLIFGNLGFPRLGVAGAAIATSGSRLVELAILVIFTHASRRRFPFIKGAYRSLKVPGELVKSIARRGAPLLMNEFLWSLGMAVLLNCYSMRGLHVVAAANISQTISNLFNVVFISSGNAIGIIVGQQLGAGKFEEAKTSAWRIIALSVAGCFIMGGAMAVAAPFIPNLYNVESDVKALATSLLWIFSAAMPVISFCHGCYFTLRSGGKTIITFLFDSGFTWLASVPMAFCLVNFTQINIVLIYVLVNSLEIIKAVVGFILVKKGVWMNNIIGEKK